MINKLLSCSLQAVSLFAASDENLVITELTKCEQEDLQAAEKSLEEAKAKLNIVMSKIKASYGDTARSQWAVSCGPIKTVELRGKYALITTDDSPCTLTVNELNVW